MSTVLVQFSDYRWTLRALHLACALARNQRTDLTLIRMIPVRNIGLLGNQIASVPLTSKEYRAIREYEATAEDYGVSINNRSMQYVTLADALVEAADHVNAFSVFADLPQSSIPYWSKFTHWNMQRRLTAAHRTLHTLDQRTDKDSWLPSITLPAQK